MKKALPANGKISKEAKETVQECVSEFISFITGEASDKCQKEKRKTINGDDLLWAMTTLGFEDYVEPLKIYLHKYREMEGERTGMNMIGRNSSSSNTNTTHGDGNGGGEGSTSGYGHGGSVVPSPMMMMMMRGHGHGNHHVYGSGTGSPSSGRNTR